MPIADSELILNTDGTIYHLNLRPEDIAGTIITVGDPDRVGDVTKHFDDVTVDVQRREFKTQTGHYGGKKLTVISTGIGTDNIDIVFNELDALANIDFSTRTLKPEFTQLSFIRIGTSGAIQPEIPVDGFLVSERAVGFDSLLHFYKDTHFLDEKYATALMDHLIWNSKKGYPYVVRADENLLNIFTSEGFLKGTTATNVGFYGPQGRKLRLELADVQMNDRLQSFRHEESSITNLEMETSGIYGMSKLLGHRAISLNAILANRALGTFSENPRQTVDQLIKKTLDLLVV
ncbi:MAG: nucleoside phosphorylase [Bacteroidota bacterium]